MKRITSVFAAGFAAVCLTASVQAAPLYDYQTSAPAVTFIDGNASAAEYADIAPETDGYEALYLSDNGEVSAPEAADSESDGSLTVQDVLKKVLYAFIAGLIIALIVCLIMKSSMRTANSKATANDYIRKNSFNITRSRDIFIYSEIAKKKRVKEENKK